VACTFHALRLKRHPAFCLACAPPSQDSNEPGKRRHLLRLWVAAENAPELPTDRGGFLKTWGSVDVGSRGGVGAGGWSWGQGSGV
jgi:hypothetical protein